MNKWETLAKIALYIAQTRDLFALSELREMYEAILKSEDKQS